MFNEFHAIFEVSYVTEDTIMTQTGWLIAALLIVLPFHTPLAAMYKWVDEEGNVSYSDQPPPDASIQEIEKKSYGISDEESQEQLEALGEKANAAKQERDIKADVAGQQTERNETIKKNCEIAQSNLQLLTSQSRVTLEGEDGNPYFLTDEDKQSKTLDARANVDRYCSE